jgi:hypothetical protein
MLYQLTLFQERSYSGAITLITETMLDSRSSSPYSALSPVPFIKQATTVTIDPTIFSYYMSIALLAAG